MQKDRYVDIERQNDIDRYRIGIHEQIWIDVYIQIEMTK